jgi:hypothetical protein
MGNLNTPCTNYHATNNGIQALLPDSSRIQATHQGLLPIYSLPTSARKMHLFPQMREALLSVGTLCDHGYEARFTAHDVKIYDNNKVIINGSRDTKTRLWRIPLTNNSVLAPAHEVHHFASSAYHQPNQETLVRFLHASAGSPVPSTWISAIDNGHYATWPGLTSALVRKHLPKSEVTVKAHIQQQRKNLRSTKPKSSATTHTPDETTNEFSPTSDSPNIRTSHIYAAIETPNDITGLIASDLTGRFPKRSHRGHNYILVIYDYDSNAILAEPLKNRQAAEILQAYDKICTRLRLRGFRPQLQRLDNEASILLKQHMTKQQIDFQLAPPDNHRRNAAERAIQTFKKHFKACLAGTDPNFPIYLWPELLPQAELTLNLLRSSRLNPKLSAYAHLEGNFDFNRTPLAPPGTKIVVHDKHHKTWALHGLSGWYLGPAIDHYRCYTTWITDTRGIRISDTVDFFPAHVPKPQTSSADRALDAAQDLIHALQNPAPAAPFIEIGHQQTQALRRLADIFKNVISTKPKLDVPDAQLPRVLKKGMPNVPTEPFPRDGPQTRSKTLQHVHHVGTIHERTYIGHSRTWTHHALQALLHQEHGFLADTIHPEICCPVIDSVTGAKQEYRDLMKCDHNTVATWERSFANELGRLSQGIRDQKGTNTIFFVPKSKVPTGRTVTYGRIVCDLKPHKTEKERTRLTVGGNLIDFPGDVSAKTADLTTAKCLFNSVISTRDARFMLIDISNFYLGTPMSRYEYMRMNISLLPEEIILAYNLRDIVDEKGWVYMEIRKGMYGLPQAGIIAQQLLQKNLAKHGYRPVRHTHGLWKHDTRPVSFSLVVDDFGVKYVGREHAQHLIDAIKESYPISVDWSGKIYCGVTLDWDYIKRQVILSMPGYVKKALHKFQHCMPRTPVHSPSQWTRPDYGAKVQLTNPDFSPPMSPSETLTLQKVCGTFLFYGRAVDPTMVHELSCLASAQAHGTKATVAQMVHFLNYCASHPESQIRYVASDMVLHIHSDASYLTEPGARSRSGGHFFFSDRPTSHLRSPLLNGPILSQAKIIQAVMSSAAEAEIGATFLNCKEAVPIRTTCEELGHPQPPTPVRVDNTTAAGIANRTVRQIRSRAMDMRFHWVQDRVDQKQFHVYWAPADTNLADYYTKHHPVKHHQWIRPVITNYPPSLLALQFLRGCVDPSAKVTRRYQPSARRTRALAHSPRRSQVRQ